MNVHFSRATDRWATPADVYRALDAEFHFDFDPCPLDGSTDGLAPLFTRWRNKRVFCNPPYGPGMAEWLQRGLEADLAVFLIPARTDTRWFHQIVIPWAKEIRFVPGRLKFGDALNSAPFPSMIVIFERGSREDSHQHSFEERTPRLCRFAQAKPVGPSGSVSFHSRGPGDEADSEPSNGSGSYLAADSNQADDGARGCYEKSQVARDAQSGCDG